MEPPTILLADTQPVERSLAWRGPGPHGLVVVASGSRGRKLMHVLPANDPASEDVGSMHGIETDVLADALLPKPSLRERCLDVTLGDVRFVGHPVTLAPVSSLPLGRQTSDGQMASISDMSVALVLAAHAAPDEEASYMRAQQACARGAAALVRGLQRAEARRRAVSRVLYTDGSNPAGAAGLLASLRRALEAVRRGREETIALAGTQQGEAEAAAAEVQGDGARGYPEGQGEGEIVRLAPPPPPPLSVRSGGLAARAGAMPPPPALRPYHALLLEQEPQALIAELPADSSPLLPRLIEAASPLCSLHELHVLTAIPLPLLFRLASHLHAWRRARIIFTITQDSWLAVHPRAPLAADSPLGRAFAAAFGRPEPPPHAHGVRDLRLIPRGSSRHKGSEGSSWSNSLTELPRVCGGGGGGAGGGTNSGAALAELAVAPSLPCALRVFSAPRRFGDLLAAAASLSIQPHQLAAIAAFLLRRRALISLHSTVLELSPPPPPPPTAPADAAAAARWRRYQQCRPMFHGQHTLEEVAWYEGLERPVLSEMLDVYEAHVAVVVAPSSEGLAA